MSQAHNRITAYHGISDRRSGASDASTSFILTVQKVFIDHHALASARDTVGATWTPDRRAAPGHRTATFAPLGSGARSRPQEPSWG